MFNLLRMDLYRMKRSKSVYVCLGILLALQVLGCWLVWLMETPEGNEIALKIGMVELTDVAELERNAGILEKMDMVGMFRDMGMNGGLYSTMLGIVVALFVCMDFHSGFIKNIMSLHRERWKYIGGKLLAAGILNFCYLALSFGVCAAMNGVFHMVEPSPVGGIVFYLAWAWLLAAAFSAFVIAVCAVAQSTAMGVLAAVLFGSGMVVSATATIMNLFHLGGWVKFTIYYNMGSGPAVYSGAGDLKIFAIGAVFLVLYGGLACAAVMKRDAA